MEVKPEYKQTEVGVIPKEWIVTTVGALIDAGIIERPLDGNHGNIHPKSSDFVDHGIPFVMANNVQNGCVDIINCAFISKQQADSLQKGFSITGDVLLTHKATIGNTAIVGIIPYPYIMLTPQVTYYRVADKTRLSNIYLRYYFDSSRFQSVLRNLAGGGTRSYIGITAQHKLPIAYPEEISEQFAIAEALSDVDALLDGLERLIAKKRDIKQATMQQLLTGQTRLSGFSEEWEIKRLAEVIDFANGKPYESHIEPTGQYFLITLDSIGIDGKLKETHRPIGFWDNSLVKGDIVTILSDIAHGNLLGLCDVIPEDNQYVLNQRVGRLRIKNDVKADPQFLRLQINRHQDHFKKRGQGTSQRHIYRRDFDDLEFKLPIFEEQTAIATIFSDMDAEIAALEARRDKTRALKQGMMQELLTGRTRLL